MQHPSKPGPDLIVYCPSAIGGICDSAHYQAEALGLSGKRVLMLCPTDYPHQAANYEQERSLPDRKTRSRLRLLRICTLAKQMLSNYAALERCVRATGARWVLMATYSEYLAPLWAWRFRRLRREKVQFGAIVHDPVRDFVIGPVWWHRRSVSAGYSFLDHAFVHENIELDTGHPQRVVPTICVPHGPYPFPQPTQTRSATRQSLGIPENAPLFLCFGHLRNGKNLHLVLEAMAKTPNAFLLVAGTEAGSGHTKSNQYIQLSETLGISERCRWRIGFATPQDVANWFHAADYVLLTYERRFRSASGVLNVATTYRKPVVASCGPSNLATSVRNYRLGVCVEPDQTDEIARGMASIMDSPPNPEWEQYCDENSWERNAQLVIDTFDAHG